MVKVLLDSDLFSDILSSRSPRVSELASNYLLEYRNFTISTMTYYESRKGLTFRPKPKVTASLSTIMKDLEVLPVRQEEAELGGIIHGLLRLQGRVIGDMDPLIAATAITYGLVLATANTSHYQYVCDAGFPLQLENWREM